MHIQLGLLNLYSLPASSQMVYSSWQGAIPNCRIFALLLSYQMHLNSFLGSYQFKINQYFDHSSHFFITGSSFSSFNQPRDYEKSTTLTTFTNGERYFLEKRTLWTIVVIRFGSQVFLSTVNDDSFLPKRKRFAIDIRIIKFSNVFCRSSLKLTKIIFISVCAMLSRVQYFACQYLITIFQIWFENIFGNLC